MFQSHRCMHGYYADLDVPNTDALKCTLSDVFSTLSSTGMLSSAAAGSPPENTGDALAHVHRLCFAIWQCACAHVAPPNTA